MEQDSPPVPPRDGQDGPPPVRDEFYQWTDTALPYFRPTAEERRRYNQEAVHLLRRLSVGSPTDPEFFEELRRANFVEDAPPAVKIGSVHQYSKKRREYFALFRRLTARYRFHRISPVRTLYWAASLIPERLPSTIPFGGFPPTPDRALADGSVRYGKLPTTFDALDWLIFDLYLGEALCALGLTWKRVEDAVYQVFEQSLPEPYFCQLRPVPPPLRYVTWKYDLGRWLRALKTGSRVEEEVKDLLRLLRETDYEPQHRKDLERLQRAARRDLRETARKWRLDAYAENGSLIIKAVVRALKELLWDQVKTQDRPPDGPAFARRIYDRRVNGTGAYPEQLWQLIADIFYHCPVIKGLPVFPPYVPWPERYAPITMTANAVRLLYVRSETEAEEA